MTEKYREIIDEFCEVAGDDDSFALEVMKIEQLKRIADVLGDINGALISMGGDIEALSGLCGYDPGTVHMGKRLSLPADRRQRRYR